jgi:hypothetical protein
MQLIKSCDLEQTLITLCLIKSNTLNSHALLNVGEAQYIGGMSWLSHALVAWRNTIRTEAGSLAGRRQPPERGVYGLISLCLGRLGLIKIYFGPNYIGMPGHMPLAPPMDTTISETAHTHI